MPIRTGADDRERDPQAFGLVELLHQRDVQHRDLGIERALVRLREPAAVARPDLLRCGRGREVDRRSRLRPALVAAAVALEDQLAQVIVPALEQVLQILGELLEVCVGDAGPVLADREVQADRRLVVGLLAVIAQVRHAEIFADLLAELLAERLREPHPRNHAHHGDAAATGAAPHEHLRLIARLREAEALGDARDLVLVPVEKIFDGQRVQDRDDLRVRVATRLVLETAQYVLDALAHDGHATVRLLERLRRLLADEDVLADRLAIGAALGDAEVPDLRDRAHDRHVVGAVVRVDLVALLARGDDLADHLFKVLALGVEQAETFLGVARAVAVAVAVRTVREPRVAEEDEVVVLEPVDQGDRLDGLGLARVDGAELVRGGPRDDGQRLRLARARGGWIAAGERQQLCAHLVEPRQHLVAVAVHLERERESLLEIRCEGLALLRRDLADLQVDLRVLRAAR